MERFLVLTLVDTGFHAMSENGRVLIGKGKVVSLMPIKLAAGEQGCRVNDRFDVWESEEEILAMLTPEIGRVTEESAKEASRLMFQEEVVSTRAKSKGKRGKT